MNTKNIAKDGLIFETLTGSTAYGTNLPTSDTDYRGIFIAPSENVITGFFPIEQWQDPDNDRVYYELRKFIKLLCDQNPNILELVWVDEQFIQYSTEEYEFLRSIRDELLSSKVKYTFSGYAHSQLKRMKNHNKWVNNPKPKQSPQQKDYVTIAKKLNFGKDNFIDLETTNEGFAFYHVHSDIYVVVPNKDKRLYSDIGEVIINKDSFDMSKSIGYVVYAKDSYTGAKNEWKGYWEWRGNRNKDRLEKEDHYGYDTKHAMHSIRLLRMGKEILETGKVNVFREDAKELLNIRHGAYNFNEILEMSDGLIADIDTLYEKTELRKKVDYKRVSKIVLEMYNMFWSNKL